MKIRHLRESDYRRMRWKNGGGWTTELAAKPSTDSPTGFDWRISIAEIDSDGDFSTFPQCDRFIALLDGNGMRLDFAEAPAALLETRLQFVKFSGDWHTRGSLLDGSVRDFNVIARRDAMQTKVLHRPLVDSMHFSVWGDATWFVHLAAGAATLRCGDERVAFARGESLWADPASECPAFSLDGYGDLIVVEFRPPTAASP
jgi:environmental stress-induced protein Ves